MKFRISQTVLRHDGAHLSVSLSPVPDRDGYASEDEMRGVPWYIWRARFIDVTEVHRPFRLSMHQLRLGFWGLEPQIEALSDSSQTQAE